MEKGKFLSSECLFGRLMSIKLNITLFFSVMDCGDNTVFLYTFSDVTGNRAHASIPRSRDVQVSCDRL